ncbi:unnamed protein product [Closterium sp. Yama58-4]|nr:unnamed protein product [Closterium sp. Yama58-4]
MATTSSRSVAGYSSSQHLKERATGARSPREYRDEEDDEREHGHEAHSPTGGSFDEGMFRQAGSPRGFGSAFHAGSPYHRVLVRLGVARLSMDQFGARLVLLTGLLMVLVWGVRDVWEEMKSRAATQGTCPLPREFRPSDEELLGRLPQYKRLVLTQPMAVKYLQLIHKYLEPWRPIKNLTSGVGRTGMVTPEVLARMARTPAIMSCAGHVKVINGKVFFRYGGFFREYYRLNRFLQTVKMIHDAVVRYQLTDMRIELFVNTCDLPMAFYSSHIDDRPGIPMMSTGFTADTIDIPVPDPLDLTEDYTPDLATQIPWERKEARAVFRGKTTSYHLNDGNWGANPRIRLHRISDAHPSLMDAHINRTNPHVRVHRISGRRAGCDGEGRRGDGAAHELHTVQRLQVLVDGGGGSCRLTTFFSRFSNTHAPLSFLSCPSLLSPRMVLFCPVLLLRWSHSRGDAQDAMKADGVVTAPRMNFTQFNAFKYQVLVDGGGGSCRTCGVLRSNQLSIRQETPIFQFYEPLLQDRVHWLTTTRTFSDLPEKVRWAQENDEEVQRLVQAANQFATYACTWTGRTLYWGLMLAKYYDTLQNPEAITEPPVKQICDKSPMLKAPPNTTADPASVKCADPDALKKNPDCIFFCSSGTINHFLWHKAEALADLKKVGPP